MLEVLIEWDQWLFGLINGDWHNGLLDQIMPYWRNKKTWIPLYFLLFFIIAKDRGLKTLWVLIIIGITIAIADQVSSELIKKMVERPRPCNDLNLEGVRELVHCGGGYSFTSSHATNHFAVAMQLFLIFRMSWNKIYFLLLFLWAALIAYGQVYVGVHYPLDVVCGAILGCFLAWLVYRFSSSIGILRRVWS
jgi:membrane-associated phospholipid phosphatase